jgi:hypothetical protein
VGSFGTAAGGFVWLLRVVPEFPVEFADTRLIQDYLGHRKIEYTVKYTASKPGAVRAAVALKYSRVGENPVGARLKYPVQEQDREQGSQVSWDFPDKSERAAELEIALASAYSVIHQRMSTPTVAAMAARPTRQQSEGACQHSLGFNEALPPPACGRR